LASQFLSAPGVVDDSSLLKKQFGSVNNGDPATEHSVSLPMNIEFA
jgi:hypothetical protein